MLVRMKTRYANGRKAIEPDKVGELPDAEARDLIAKGFAVPVGADPSHDKDAKRPRQSGRGGRQPAGRGAQGKPRGGGKTDGAGGDAGAKTDGAGGEPHGEGAAAGGEGGQD